MTRADPETGATLISGRCAACGEPVTEGEPSGLWFLADHVPIPAGRVAEAPPVGLFHERCAPTDNSAYLRESFHA